MEFDTSVRLREAGSFEVDSHEDFEGFARKFWDMISADASNVGDAGGGEFWIDYSDLLRTRYLVCNISEVPASERHSTSDALASEGHSTSEVPAFGGHRYSLRFRSGSKPGRIADVLILAIALLAFWLLGKSFVPGPGAWLILPVPLCVAADISIILICGKAFGSNRVAALKERLLDQ